MASEDLQRKADKVASVAARADGPVHEGSQLLQGKVPSDDSKSMGHPIHPATVHWPIAVSPHLHPSIITTLRSLLIPSPSAYSRVPVPSYPHIPFTRAFGSRANPSSSPPHSQLQP